LKTNHLATLVAICPIIINDFHLNTFKYIIYLWCFYQRASQSYFFLIYNYATC
jgi:hypothetical protein